MRCARFSALSGAAACLLLALGAGGCGTVHFDVPEGARVKLLEVDAPVAVRVERTCWFALWGAEPLDDNHTASIIAEHRLTEVRLHNEYSASDAIINTFTSIFSFSRRRIVVEGNTSPAPATAPAPTTASSEVTQ